MIRVLIKSIKVTLIEKWGDKLDFRFLNTSKNMRINELWKIIRRSKNIIIDFKKQMGEQVDIFKYLSFFYVISK